jgi:hypothetical protein
VQRDSKTSLKKDLKRRNFGVHMTLRYLLIRIFADRVTTRAAGRR